MPTSAGARGSLKNMGRTAERTSIRPSVSRGDRGPSITTPHLGVGSKVASYHNGRMIDKVHGYPDRSKFVDRPSGGTHKTTTVKTPKVKTGWTNAMKSIPSGKQTTPFPLAKYQAMLKRQNRGA